MIRGFIYIIVGGLLFLSSCASTGNDYNAMRKYQMGSDLDELNPAFVKGEIKVYQVDDVAFKVAVIDVATMLMEQESGNNSSPIGGSNKVTVPAYSFYRMIYQGDELIAMGFDYQLKQHQNPYVKSLIKILRTENTYW